MGKKTKSFSLAEMLIALLLTTILISATMPLMTKQKSKGDDPDSIACIKNDLIKNASLNISQTACNSNPNSPCCNSIVSCRYKMTGACTTLAYYADYGKTEEKTNARKVLREVCDLGGEKACDYFAMSCKRDPDVCDIPDSDNDLAFYLNLAPSNPNPGKIIMEDLVSKYYNQGYQYITEKIDSICQSDPASTACIVKNGNPTTPMPWEKRFGGSGDDQGRGIAIESGIVYLTGQEASDTAGSNDVFAIKLDPNGNVVWKKKFGGANADIGYGIAVESGNVYLAGYETSDTAGAYDAYAIKLDNMGNVVWKKKFGGAGDDYVYGIAVESGNVYLAGFETSDTAGGYDIFAVKLDNMGNVVWKKKFGGTGDDYGCGIAVESGNAYLAGYEISDTAGINDPFAIKLDANGNVVWKKKFGGAADDYGSAIAVESGNAYLIGEHDDAGDYDVYAIKLDNMGNVVWKKKFGGAGGETGSGIAAEPGYVYLTGGSDTAGNNDAYAIKLDNMGNVVWKKKFGGTSYDAGNGIAVESGNVYLTGYQQSDTAGSNDTFVIKLLANQTSNLSSAFDGIDLNSTYNGGNLSIAFNGSNTTISAGNLNASFNGANLNSSFDGALLNKTKFLGFD